MVLLPEPPRVPITDVRSGAMAPVWRQWFTLLFGRVGGSEGGGAVFLPSSSTDTAVARWSGTAGDTLQDSNVLVSGAGNINVPGGATVDGRDVSADGSTLDSHVGDTSNPHGVTKSQVGLGNVTDDAQLAIANDLSDLNDASAARGNLGLGDSATRDVGDGASDVAPGDVLSGVTDRGTISTGTITPEPADGRIQTAVNDGAHTLAAPTGTGFYDLVYTNGASAGAITASGFTAVLDSGGALSNTDENSVVEIRVRQDGTTSVLRAALLVAGP